MFLMEFNEMKLSNMSNIWQEENRDDVDKKIFYFSKHHNQMTFLSPVSPLSIFDFFLQKPENVQLDSGNAPPPPPLWDETVSRVYVQLISQFTKGSIKTEPCWTRFLIFFTCLIEKAFNHWAINNEIKDSMNNKWKPWEVDNVGL